MMIISASDIIFLNNIIMISESSNIILLNNIIIMISFSCNIIYLNININMISASSDIIFLSRDSSQLHMFAYLSHFTHSTEKKLLQSKYLLKSLHRNEMC